MPETYRHTISLIIPTYNRSAVVKEMLNCLAKQTLDGSFDYEIIGVDNNSQDDTRAGVESCIPQFAGKLKYLFEPRQGKVLALNLSIEASKGDIIEG